MTRSLRTAGLAVVMVLAFAVPALGQALPDRPDLPPPDPSPPASPAPSRTPSAPQVDPGPTPAELEAQRLAEEASAAKAAEAKRRQEATRRRQKAIRRRQEAIRRAREERASEFRNLQGAYDGVLKIGDRLSATSRSLESLAVSAGVAASTTTTDEPAGSSGSTGVLMVVLLIASGISAALVLLPAGVRATHARRGEGELADNRGVGGYVAERIPVLEHRRLELAGVSVACLLLAVLILVGLI